MSRAGGRSRLVGFVVSAGILLVLYTQIDFQGVGRALRLAPPAGVLAVIGIIVPLTLLRAWRFLLIAPPGAVAGFSEAVRLTLVASTMNLFIPAKAGDLVKSFFIVRQSGTAAGTAVSVVAYERVADLFGLICWCLVGAATGGSPPGLPTAGVWFVLLPAGVTLGALLSGVGLAPLSALVGRLSKSQSRLVQKVRNLLEGWPALHASLGGRRWGLIGFSLGLWLLQLTQVWLFARVVGVDVPFGVGITIGALALVAGQLPLTFGGLGTRDLALVGLLASYGTPEAAAAVGLLTATRNFLPPLAGLPLLRPYLAQLSAAGREWRSRH